MFPNGLSWNAAVADVCRVEEVDEDDAQKYLLQSTGDVCEYWFDNTRTDGGPAGAYYIFHNDLLACHGIDYCPNEPEPYAAIQDDLTAAYGEPVETSPGEVVAMFNTYKEDFPPEILHSQVAWALGEGTKVFFLNISGELYVFYVNEARLFDIADGSAPPPPETD